MKYMKDEGWFSAAAESHRKQSGRLLDPKTLKINMNHIDYELLPNAELMHQLALQTAVMAKKWQKAAEGTALINTPNLAVKQLRRIEKELTRLITDVRQEVVRIHEAENK